MDICSEQLRTLSLFFDDSNAHRDPEAVTWGRISKIAEEHGEAVAAYIGATGQNVRKGITHTIDDVIRELLDVAVTALGAAEHMADHDGETMNRLDAHIRFLSERLGLLSSKSLIDRLEWWGEQGERIACEGHVDLAEFTAAADEISRRDAQIDGDELPSADHEAAHIWIRPLTIDYAIRVYGMSLENAQIRVAGGEHYEPCEQTDSGARPVTVIDTGV